MFELERTLLELEGTLFELEGTLFGPGSAFLLEFLPKPDRIGSLDPIPPKPRPLVWFLESQRLLELFTLEEILDPED